MNDEKFTAEDRRRIYEEEAAKRAAQKQPAKKKGIEPVGIIFLIIVGIALVSVVGKHLGIAEKSSSTAPPKRVLDAKIKVEPPNLVVTNTSGFTLTPRTGYSGKNAILFELNDTFQFFYRGSIPHRELVRIPLASFMKKDGTRFNYSIHGVKSIRIWSEEDIQSFSR